MAFLLEFLRCVNVIGGSFGIIFASAAVSYSFKDFLHHPLIFIVSWIIAIAIKFGFYCLDSDRLHIDDDAYIVIQFAISLVLIVISSFVLAAVFEKRFLAGLIMSGVLITEVAVYDRKVLEVR